jgi:hypothetical protein
VYIYKFTITYNSGRQATEWVTCEEGESLSSLKDRADSFVDELEADKNVSSVRMVRRTVPGI